MNENTKKILVIVAVVVGLVAAGLGAMQFFGGEQGEVVRQLPGDPNFKSEKEAALEGKTPAGGPAAVEAGGEKDLSGALGGG